MPDLHSDYSPSRLARIIDCPGSVDLIKTLQLNGTIPGEQPASSYAEHGTFLHEKIAPWIQQNSNSVDKELKPEEYNILQDCLEYTQTLRKTVSDHYEIEVERSVSMKNWGFHDIYGTADFILKDYKRQHIDILDWKFGSGVIVYAKDNPQALAYTAGAADWPTYFKTMTLHIFQPYIDHVSTWDITLKDLHTWVYTTLAPAVFDAEYGNKTINPTEKACMWCEAKNHCVERFSTVQQSALEIFEAQANLPNKINPNDLVNIIFKAPLVEQAIKDIKLFVKTEIERGAEYTGLKVVRGRANRKWKYETAVIEWLSDLDIDDAFNSKLKSPSQLEKIDRTLKKNKDFQALYHKPEGKATLVSASDPRPAIPSTSGAIDVFKDTK